MDATDLSGPAMVISATRRDLLAQIAAVPDPEIPVLTISDLGILRAVEVTGDRVQVTITPTYSGCPAMEAIANDIARVVTANGMTAEITTTYSPAWTTVWMSAEGKQKLLEYGIAPPGSQPLCPQCRSHEVSTISEFGSTACKALLVCGSCAEPFDHFKDL